MRAPLITRKSVAASWRRRLGHFARRSGFEQVWLLPAWLLLGFSRTAIVVVPFRHIAPRMGVHLGNRAWVPLLTAEQRDLAVKIGSTVRLASRFTPWVSNCFPQALAASILLRLYGVPYVLNFGLAPGEADKRLQAHAWVAAGAVAVTGGSSFDDFTVVGCFGSPTPSC
jgi:hypothetical protein